MNKNPYFKTHIKLKKIKIKKTKGQKITESYEKKKRIRLEALNKSLGRVVKINKKHGRKSTTIDTPDLENEKNILDKDL